MRAAAASVFLVGLMASGLPRGAAAQPATAERRPNSADATFAVLDTTTSAGEFASAMRAFVRAQDRRAAPVLLRRLGEFPDIEADIVSTLYFLDAPEALEPARGWAKRSLDTYTGAEAPRSLTAARSQGLRFWSAMILLRHGDRARDEGLAEMGQLLAHDPALHWTSLGADALIAHGGPRAWQLLCGTAAQPGVSLAAWESGMVVRRLLRMRCDEAYELLVTRLRGAAPSADEAAVLVAKWRKTAPGAYDVRAPAAERARRRAALRAWLADQYARVRNGQPSEL